jgi:two-component system sensor histidine kinase PilS (NtrC family)
VSEPQLNHATVGSGKVSSTETELNIERNGDTIHLLVATSPLQLDNTELNGTVVVVYDVTRLKQFEREAARRERLSEMGHLAAGVAHEIRNPLNTISIAAQRLASEFTPDQNPEEYAGMTSQIRQEAIRLNEIITRFLTLAREEKKRFQPVAIDSLIEEFVHFIMPEAEKLKIELSIDLASASTIQADEGSLKQLFTNLFNNAKEALNGKAGRIRIVTKLVDGKVQIYLADSGHGIKASIREKVFTPYFTTKDAGTGLGLPTVHKIISEMNGDITVTDSDLGGAEFVITLPSHS